MTFTQLEIFALIAELKSFTATAEKLGISQSAVSHALKSLEQQWGINLISRTQSDIELTTTGQQLLPHVKELLSISDTLEKEVAAIHGLNEGTLCIGSFGASSSIYLLPEILETFRRRYPKIEIYIDEGEDKEVAQWLLERRIEVGFLIMPDERFD
ncbi:MAG: LysR family transcriptional regulator, partial [Acinetobacter sp.]|nr:LysR family transcriptional regulator [Acinetobacter sp.]